MKTNRHPLFALLLTIPFIFLINCFLVSSSANAAIKTGDVIQPANMISVEGVPVSLYPSKGKIQVLLFLKTVDLLSDNWVQEYQVFYKRFHDKGLNTVSIISDISEDEIFSFSERWQIPWPQVLDFKENPFFEKFGITSTPYSVLIDSEGKVMAVDLKGEAAHQAAANLLKVSLTALPMPESPIERPQNPLGLSINFLPEGTVTAPNVQERAGILTALFSVTNKFFGASVERDEVEGCKENMRKIGLALTQYRINHKDLLPNSLSDLYPDYIIGKETFSCSRKGASNPYPDSNKMGTYIYDFAPGSTASHRINREWKTEQLKEFGDSVPVVRCWNHPRSINLTYGGQINFYETIWEDEVPKGHTLLDMDAKTRAILQKIAVALDQFKQKKGKVPNELDELFPDYIKDKSSFVLPSQNASLNYTIDQNRIISLIYEFSPSMKNPQGGTNLEWKTSQLKKYGGYVPFVRVRGVLDDAKVMNLAYNGEIWEGQENWEEDLTDTPKTNTPISSKMLTSVLYGEEDITIKRKGWNETPVSVPVVIENPAQMLPLRGLWTLMGKKILHKSNAITQTALLFSPYLEKGEFVFKAKANSGNEGVRVIFGYKSASNYFVWNIGGWENTYTVFEKRDNLHANKYELLCEKIPFTLKHEQWHDLRLVLDSAEGVLAGYVDGNKILALKTIESIKGRLGIGTWLTDAEFESIVITPR